MLKKTQITFDDSATVYSNETYNLSLNDILCLTNHKHYEGKFKVIKISSNSFEVEVFTWWDEIKFNTCSLLRELFLIGESFIVS